MKRFLLAAVVAASLAGCAKAPQDTIGAAYGLYQAAVSAETVWLENSKPAPSTVATISAARKSAYDALNKARTAVASGASGQDAAVTAANTAVADLLAALAAQGVKVQ